MKKNHAEAVIVTVGTTQQKKLCEKLISDMKEISFPDIIVVSDEDFGSRIGSGGALIGVIEKFYETGKKLLVINSGGKSQRSINYAVRGKLFANLFINGETVSLLEMLMSHSEKLFKLIDSGVIVCCSDILVDTGNLKNKFSNNFGLTVRTDFETGSRHGVMYRGEKNLLQIYPHKISPEKLQALSEKYGEEGALVDTGVIYFKDEVCKALQKCAREEKIAEKLVENKIDLNLYPDIVALLAKEINEDEYFSSSNETHKKIKEILYNLLSPFTLEVSVCEGQNLVHMGSLRESRENIFKLAKEKDNFLSLNSFVDKSSVIGKNTVLDNVILENCRVGENCIVSDITLENGAEICDGKAVCGIKLSDGSFVAIVCSIDENPKEKSGESELWDVPRFYRGKTYTESYNKFTAQINEEKLSMAYCVENADTDFYFTRCRYIKDMSSYKLNDDYFQMRKEIITRYFSKKEKVKTVLCKKEKVQISLPVRVNFSGTWTDAMPYCIENGGEVMNMAVTVDGKKPIEVTAEKIQEKRIEFCSDGVSENFFFDKEKTGEELSDFNLHRAVLETVGINAETCLEDGFRLTTKVTSIDKGSGLGTSSILLGGCFKALGDLLGREFTEDEIFEMVFVAEQIMKTGGGWQDQAGGLTSGLKVTSTDAGYEQKLSVKEITLSENFRKFISEKFVLIPTGQRHFGRFIVNDVAVRFFEKNKASLQGHFEIKELNKKVLKSIEEENFKEFLNCLNEHFRLLKKISPAVSNEKIDALSEDLLEKYVDAVSICGAGGGGYLLAVMKDGITVKTLNGFIKNNFSYITGGVKKIDIFY